VFPVRRREKNVSENEILKVEHLKKYFPVEKSFLEKMLTRTRRFVRAVDDVSFSVRKGEIFTLAGESGCGKTTTGKLVVRLMPPTSGKIFFNGAEITELDHEALRVLRRKMQIIFQDPYASFNPRMKIGKAVGHPLEIHGLARHEETRESVLLIRKSLERHRKLCYILEKAWKNSVVRSLERYLIGRNPLAKLATTRRVDRTRERVLEILDRVGLTPAEKFVDLYPHQMSGGQRQRAAMARALILQPEFIVADEPVSMIDVSLRTAIIDLMLNLRKDFGLTYLFITHDLAIAKYISDRIAIMYLGKIVELADKQTIFANPLHPYTQALLAAIPVPVPEQKRKKTELIGDVPSAINIPSGCRFRTRCRYAKKACAEKEPQLIPVAPNHYVACNG
jgi:peptide/nickel transport system ATP-binding protein